MSTTHKAKFKVGDWVSFPSGSLRVYAQVIEDQGVIGSEGRQLYRIRIPPSRNNEADVFLASEDDLTKAPAPQPELIAEYFRSGALLEILRQNPSKVWLTHSPRGEISHTFDEISGLLGGAVPPVAALQEGRIFRPKANAVLAFLQCFGLEEALARDVLNAVGYAPA